ncbi:MAG: AAA family ATPase [Gammaproteobacteria bacterium]|nr:AAA family ATPase [Gammaproteobacteria bacterium]
MAKVKPLSPSALYHACDPKAFGFRTTAEVEPLQGFVGQERAERAARFGVGIEREGYNLFVVGRSGVGKHHLLRQFLEQAALAKATPPDWIYVNNFISRRQPLAMRLPPGRGQRLKDDMQALVKELRTAITNAFEHEDYQSRADRVKEGGDERNKGALLELAKQAEEKGIKLIQQTPGGYAFAPVVNGEVVDSEAIDEMSERARKKLRRDMAELERQLQELLKQINKWTQEARDALRLLNEEVTRYAMAHLTDALKRRYSDLPEVLDFLSAVEADLVDNVDVFLGESEEAADAVSSVSPENNIPPRYQVNVVVSHCEDAGAPVVIEDLPTYQNLVGNVEHVTYMGTVATDFTLIRPGALHRANGGYLLVDAEQLLSQPYAWDSLKRVLRSGEIRIDSLERMLTVSGTVSLEPQAIPLDCKIVLLGEYDIYFDLMHYDREFGRLFKVLVDFSDDMPRSLDNETLFAGLLAGIIEKEGLRHLSKKAFARVVEYSARLTDDGHKLTLRASCIADLLREADFWASQVQAKLIDRVHVDEAIRERDYRFGRFRDESLAEIHKGIVMIDTAGEVVGQTNGLTVIELGEYLYGQPSRITATVRHGDGEVLDIERKVELGGAIHSKGVMILSAFIGARFGKTDPIYLAASLVFEQSYGMVDGDSASMAEMITLLSAVANVPVRQCLAITGSMNQLGQVQPIGGVNEKIEGFFDICKARGFVPGQGVVIPSQNVAHLMLREDVVAACKAGQFSIYAVSHVDEATELLLGITVGTANAKGQYAKGTLNRIIQDKLAALVEQEHASHDDEKPKKDKIKKDKKNDEPGEAEMAN